MKKPWRTRFRNFRLKREKDQPLDEAIYMSAATGRLEPLLRALAIYPVYSSGQVTHSDDSHFLLTYSTRLRATDTSPIKAALLTEHVEEISTKFAPLGAILNPGGKFEITLEAHNLPRLHTLVAGLPSEDALTPIASESLAVTPATDNHNQLLNVLTQRLRVPAGQMLRVLTAEFHGFKPDAWPVLFLVNPDGVPQEIPAFLSEQLNRDFPQVIVVNPAIADWRRDLFWHYRELLL
ncbi:hypothetical protein [Varibaculum vaginae]|uniref:hypothetical protein n=1 Tax=Varibaculum vaginae TaxID=2364797 RepID=UPI000F07A727|nr:hypothetical protein [Varibaculum vaginae]